ncbi:uncharacterized protein A4U43_C02F3740 [Asparagus officinalis]|uniref:Uncharacterized protein n=1 Tax=Asparagus officinalis TaxID=4686 RepID=A0A5P1FHG0_ASPOF|nr:uncharacterized protein A4U43_C02F3740 [Asparagus officinalis]
MSLSVSECPRLKSLPWGLKGSPLKELDIHSCQSLEIKDPLKRVVDLGGCPLLKNVEKLTVRTSFSLSSIISNHADPHHQILSFSLSNKSLSPLHLSQMNPSPNSSAPSPLP